MEVFSIKDERNAVTIVEKGIEYGHSIQAETIIVDTAGRLQVQSRLEDTVKRVGFVDQ